MKKALMILAIGLFLGTIGYTSVAAATTVDNVECEGNHDKKKCKDKDCKKEGCDKAHEGDKKACCSNDKAKSGDKKAYCSKDEAKKATKTAEKKHCSKKKGKKSCCAKKAEHK